MSSENPKAFPCSHMLPDELSTTLAQIPSHPHRHSHHHTESTAVINRLSRTINHLNTVRNMIEADRDCTEVLIQLSAVQSALSATAKIMIKDHIQHCMTDALEDPTVLQDLNEAIEKLIR